ncbi:MAG: hypothetical protein M1376_15565 [Planctomycetes bacterium]|nr:hypothetical protein [Planctomycetota bacterium]
MRLLAVGIVAVLAGCQSPAPVAPTPKPRNPATAAEVQAALEAIERSYPFHTCAWNLSGAELRSCATTGIRLRQRAYQSESTHLAATSEG